MMNAQINPTVKSNSSATFRCEEAGPGWALIALHNRDSSATRSSGIDLYLATLTQHADEDMRCIYRVLLF